MRVVSGEAGTIAQAHPHGILRLVRSGSIGERVLLWMRSRRLPEPTGAIRCRR